MYFEDLTPCGYFGVDVESCLTSVGWLEMGEHFTRGEIEQETFRAIQELLVGPWQPMLFMGHHQCSICQFDGPSGVQNLFIPHEGQIFVCPELILHHFSAHHYQPPEIYLKAVLDCPPTRSMEFKKRLLACGGRPLTKL